MSEQGAGEFDGDAEGHSRSARVPSSVPEPHERVWRHPAEIAAAHRASLVANTPADAPMGESSLAAAAVAALGGGLLITGLWLAMSSTASAPVAGAGESFAAEVPATDADALAALPTPVADSTVEIRDVNGDLLGFGVVIGAGDRVITATDPRTAAVDVVLPDGSSTVASVVGHDAMSGLTALRLSDASITPAVTAATAPTELAGRVAGSADVSPVSLTTVPGERPWSHAVFEFEAVIGHLGSPVVNADGAVVGLVTGHHGDRTQITSIATVERVAEQLFVSGEADHPWLGIEGRDDIERGGALVTAVIPGGPAAAHHLEPGNRIVGAGSLDVRSMSELLAALRVHSPGDLLILQVETEDGTRRVPIELGHVT